MSSTESAIASAPRVLVVEDEPMLLKSVVTGLRKLAGVDVVGAPSVAAALTEIQARAPAVVISDIDLPDRSGIELLGELGARGLKPHVIFVSAYVKAYRAQIPPHAGVEVMEKPVSLETLRNLVNQRVASPVSASSPFGVADYLQLASLGHHSVVLDIGGSVSGRICVVEGEAWSAVDAQGEGMDAFRRLALARDVLVQCQTLAGDPGPRSLTGSCESLLLECARLHDEARANAPVQPEGFTELALDEGPNPDAVPTTPYPVPMPPLAAAPAEVAPPPGMTWTPPQAALATAASAHAPGAPSGATLPWSEPAGAASSPAPVRSATRAEPLPATARPAVPPPPRIPPVVSSPSRAPEPPPAPKPPAPTFEDLFELAVEASLAKRHADALELFRQAGVLKPEDLKVKVNISRLEKLLRGPEEA